MGNSVMLNGIEYAGEQIAYKDSTYELVSKVAYLIGVPLRIFQNEHEPPKIEIYNRLEQDKNARIIRNLCIIRTAIERNYRKINDIMRMEYRGLLSMPEILPTSSMQQLSNDGISFIKKSSTKLCHHIIEINRLISDRINNCKSPCIGDFTVFREGVAMPLIKQGSKLLIIIEDIALVHRYPVDVHKRAVHYAKRLDRGRNESCCILDVGRISGIERSPRYSIRMMSFIFR